MHCARLAIMAALVAGVVAGPAAARAEDQAENRAAASDSPDGRKTEFLYFKDEQPAPTARNGAAATGDGTFTAGSSLGKRFLRLDNQGRLVGPAPGVFTMRAGRDAVGFVPENTNYSSTWLFDGRDENRPSLGLFTRVDTLPAFDFGLDDSFVQHNQQIGLRLDYSGFSIDAALAQLRGGLTASGGSALELGLGYHGRSWRTSLQISGLQQSRQAAGFIDVGDGLQRAYAVELGAAYMLGSGFALTGGVRYQDFGDRYRFIPGGQSGSDSLIYMGTEVNF